MVHTHARHFGLKVFLFLFFSAQALQLWAGHSGQEPVAHDDQPSSSTAAGEAEPALLEPDRETMESYFDLFTRLIADAPCPLSDNLIEHAVPLQGALDHQPWGPADAPAMAQMMEETRAFAEKLRNWFIVLPFTWPGAAASSPAAGSPVPLDKPIDLALGLIRPVLVEVDNPTSAPVSLTPQIHGLSGPLPNPVRIPAGSRRMILAPLVAVKTPATTETLTTVSLNLVPSLDAGTTRTLIIPVRVRRPAILKGKILDAQSGQPFPGRVWVSGSDNLYRFGKAFTDNTTLSEKPILQVTPRPKMMHLPFFYSDGTFEVAVPAGEVTVTLERGFEWPIIRQKVTLKPGEEQEITLSSARYLDMKSMGWISGDTHVHWSKNSWDENEDLELLKMVQQAEDLRVINNLTLKINAPPDLAFIAPTQLPMGTAPGSNEDYHLQMGEEYRNEFYGHQCFLNLKQLVEPISTGSMGNTIDWPLNKSAIEECRRQGGLNVEANGLGLNWDVPINVINGLSDLVDQIEPEDYYRFLNCGFHLALGNGSDHPARVTGCARMYAKGSGPGLYAQWLDGIRAGRTFTTSGPLLFMTVNGHEIGDHFEALPGEELEIKVHAFARKPVGNLEIVSNGEVIQKAKIEGTATTMTVKVKADEPRWFVARCSPAQNFSAIAAPDVAHTSAIYADLGGQGVFKDEAAESFATAMRAHAADVSHNGRFADARQRQAAVRYLEDGAAKYDKLIKQHKRQAARAKADYADAKKAAPEATPEADSPKP